MNCVESLEPHGMLWAPVGQPIDGILLNLLPAAHVWDFHPRPMKEQ